MLLHFKLPGTKNNQKQTNLTIQSVLQDAIRTLHTSSARLDAELLLCSALGENRAYLFSHFSEPISPEKKTVFLSYIQRRRLGEPISYIIGTRNFYGLVLQVNPSVLIPRPETELLVDLVLDECKQYDTSIHILDMCSGSGAIAIALAKNCNRVVVDAVDISLNAVELAKRNVRFQNVGSSVNVFQSDCFVNVNKRYNVIVANPP